MILGRRDRNRFAAAASPGLVLVLKGEARLKLARLEIEPHSEQKQQVLGDENLAPLVFHNLVGRLGGLRKIDCVRQARAASLL